MNTSNRLPPQPGEWINRSKPIRFQFEGRQYIGCEGDTITSALVANGIKMLGRSFKYHRPRGVYSMANHDVNALVQEGVEPNIRADVTPIREGGDYEAVNTFGGLAEDKARALDMFGAFLPVGFYYKTFHRPAKLFPFFERRMREMAGLGTIDGDTPRAHTPKRYAFCDVLVIGGGPAGLSAGIAAAQQGLRVVIVDEQPRPGGSLHYQWSVDPRAASLLADLLSKAAALANLQMVSNTVAAGYYADHWVALVDDKKLTKMRARCVVFATGAFEQPALFRNNDLPGVMLASGVQRLVHQFATKPFDSCVVLTANSDGYRAAVDFQRAGIHVKAVLDLRRGGERSELAQRCAQEKIPVRNGVAIYEAIAVSGKAGIKGVHVCAIREDGEPQTDRTSLIVCDGVAMSVGWAPTDGLASQAGVKMTYAPELEQFIPGTLPPGIFIAGRANGMYPLDDQLADGTRVGKAASVFLGNGAELQLPAPQRTTASTHPYPVVDHPDGKIFVDLDEDVQYKDIVHAEMEGFDNIELLKRYSTFGMGPAQGKTANTNVIRVLAKIKGKTPGEIGAPTSRPFFHPVSLAKLAGRGFHAHRHTAMHHVHKHAGAVFMAAGEWARPAYYAVGETSKELCVREEVAAVRNKIGIIDVGTLGKIEITGKDTAQFIERVYTGRFANMKFGTTRYGLMCDESGVIIDDGVVGRLGENAFYVTTTTTASGAIYREMQRYAIIWGLDVILVNLTGQYGAMNVAGPLSRELMRGLTDLDLSDKAFPYLGLREAKVAGVPAKLMRVGFVGELGYEIHVPTNSAARVWDAIMQAGQEKSIRPFGVEAQRVLRLEKGHVIIGQDTDGLTRPFEAAMDWAVKMDKPFFIGQRSLQIVSSQKVTRKLVGFMLAERWTGPVPKECHLVIADGEITGRVTSVTRSPTLDRVIGLAYVAPKQAAPGTHFEIRVDKGDIVTATVVELPFYDHGNKRQAMGG